jgi:hypothetical protein
MVATDTAYRTRLLPPSEWGKLAGTELGPVVSCFDPAQTGIVVVEDDAGAIVGCWALYIQWHAEGVWVAPTHRGKAAVARHLRDGLLVAARGLGAQAVWTAALTPEIERLVRRHLRGVPVPGQHFVFGTGG